MGLDGEDGSPHYGAGECHPYSERKASHLLPTWQDIQVLTAMHQALSSLSSLTNMLSGGEYVTVSAILPMLKLIETKLLKDEAGDAQLTKDIRSHIQQDLNSRYTIPKISAMTLKILQVATFLAPRSRVISVMTLMLQTSRRPCKKRV